MTAAQDRLDKLRLVVMAKATHKAWDNMENFVRGGAKTGVFDGSLLVSGKRDKEPMDWGSLQDLIQQTSEAASDVTETAEKEEMDGLWEKGCFRKVHRSDLPSTTRIFSSRFHYKIKRCSATSALKSLKVRLAAW